MGTRIRLKSLSASILQALSAALVPLVLVATLPAYWGVQEYRASRAAATNAELREAARTGNLAAIERALAGGADIDAVEPVTGLTALMWGARSGRLDVVELLLSQGANLHMTSGAARGTALGEAAYCPAPDVVRVLLEAGADPNAKTWVGYSPLMMAVVAGEESIVEMLLDAGADVHARDVYGNTPLSAAADDGGNAGILRRLEKHVSASTSFVPAR